MAEKKQRKRKRRPVDPEKVKGLQATAYILKEIRLGNGLNTSMRAFADYISELSGEEFMHSYIQRYESAGTTEPYNETIRTINPGYLRAIAPISPFPILTLELLSDGYYKINQPPLGALLEEKRETLGVRFQTEMERLELSEEEYQLAREGKIRWKSTPYKLSLFLSTPETVVLDSAITQIYVELGFIESSPLEKVNIPSQFSDIKDLMNWFVGQFGFERLQQEAEISLKRLEEISNGDPPTPEELADLAYSIKSITRDNRFTYNYVESLLNPKRTNNKALRIR